MDNELLLFDRINVIKDTVKKYGEENFYISFSGGKDSTILHYLIDLALPNNNIPRVFINTGIEYQAIVEFVKGMAEKDERFVIVKPSQPIKPMLEKYGYPFKSKEHSTKLHEYQMGHLAPSIVKYINKTSFGCPKLLKYQFSPDFKIKVSQFCCMELKKKPIKKWEKENERRIGITGMRKEEGGQRSTLNCILTNKKGDVVRFHPLAKIDNDFENWFIGKLEQDQNKKILCELYYPPFDFKRTGCAGCPYNLNLQEDLEKMERLLPNERKKCEVIWKPIYEEYRRLNYRLKGKEQLSLFEEE